jgi:streptogramin lyase
LERRGQYPLPQARRDPRFRPKNSNSIKHMKKPILLLSALTLAFCLCSASSYAFGSPARDGKPPGSGGAPRTLTPPSITKQPASLAVDLGAKASFTVTAAGTAPLYYQWQFNGASLPGATNAALSIASAQTTNEGNYQVVVTNVAGSVASSNATLTVVVPPAIIQQPQNLTVVQGATASFGVAAAGSPPLQYQWQFQNANLTGATNSTLTLTNVQAAKAGLYRVLVKNAAATVTSSNAQLTVNVPPSITTQPASETVNAGAAASFSVTASGTAPLFYQWQFNGASLPGATNPTLSLVNVQLGQAGTYDALVSNLVGSASSSAASLTVKPTGVSSTYVAAGRAALAAKKMDSAYENFSAAVALAPTDPTANAFLAATRVLDLPNQGAAQTLLNLLGFAQTNRDIYHWTAGLPDDTNGVPLAPAGVSATVLTAYLRGTVIPALLAAETNLAQVTATNFLLSLSSQETDSAAVTLDYGDVLLLRALLEASAYFGYTINSLNVDAQFTALRSMDLDKQLTPGRLLAEYPELFTFSTTNDLAAAKLAFSNAANLYFQASAFIRARPISETRLFNYDLSMAKGEATFRETLTNLQSSLSGAVRLRANTNYVIDMAPLFDGLHSWRSFLPEFSGKNFVVGTLDPTFGGVVVSGLDLTSAEAFLAKRFTPALVFASRGEIVREQFVVQLDVLPGYGYAIESSPDLVNWTPVLSEFATNSVITLADPDIVERSRFYRAVRAANDRFVAPSTISGFPATAPGSNEGATSEPDEPNYFNQNGGAGTPVWWAWTAPSSGVVGVSASASGFQPLLGVFTGPNLPGLASAQNLAANNNGEFDFQAVAGTTYYIGVDSAFNPFNFFNQQGNLTLTIAGPPANDNFANRQTLTGTSVSVNGSNILATEEQNEPSNGGASVWYSWTAPANGSVVLSLSGPAYPNATVFTGGDLASLVQVSGYGYSSSSFDAVEGVTYQIQIDGYQTGNFTLGLTQYAGRYFLSLSGYPAEGGSIVAQPSPDANGTCAAGAKVTVKAQPAAGFVLSGWTGSVNTNGSVPQVVLVMTNSQYLQAAFEPANDSFANRAVLSGAGATVNGSTAGAPFDQVNFNQSVWYTWTAPASGIATFWLASANYLQLGVYTGEQESDLSPVMIFSSGEAHGTISQTFDAVAGETYQIQVSDYGDSGDFVLLFTLSEGYYTLSESVNPPQGGSIVANPSASANGLFPAGETVTLTAQPSPGWVFAGWSGSQSGSSTNLEVVMNGSQFAQANFDPPGTVLFTFSTLAGAASPGSADGAGSAARFNDPSGVAVDGAGNVYIADTYNNTIRKMTPAGVVTTLAGSAGNSGGADGAGAGAQFNGPAGVAVDGAGNIYVADTYNNTIRKVTPAGVVTTLAGQAGNSGAADGAGPNAQFYNPSGLAVDRAGNVYVADSGNSTIRKVTSAGFVTTLAGAAGNSGSADGTGTNAQFSGPLGVAVDAAGNVYVADSQNNTIRKVTAAGVVTTLAGDPNSGAGSSDGTGANAQFSDPSGAAVDGAGNLYVADGYNNTIRKVTSAGVVTTLAGSAGNAGSADGSGSSASFSYPSGVAVTGGGVLYVADSYNNTIRKVTAAGAVTTVAGVAPGSADGLGSAARFNDPSAVAVDISGNLYVADSYNNTIRKVTPAGLVSTLAGNPKVPPGSADGTGAGAQFNYPSGVAVDGAGNVYVADSGNNTIRKITRTGIVTTLAGQAGNSGNSDGTGTNAQFNQPSGVAVDGEGNIYVADYGNSAIRLVTPAGVVTTLPGGQLLSGPSGVAVDRAGNVYVADYSANTIDIVTPEGVATTLAGSSGFSGFQDGPGADAQFAGPSGVAVDGAGNVYVADEYNNAIRRVTPAGVVTTLAGSGNFGSSDGIGMFAQFNHPSGVAVDAAGNLYVADSSNNTIRKGTP